MNFCGWMNTLVMKCSPGCVIVYLLSLGENHWPPCSCLPQHLVHGQRQLARSSVSPHSHRNPFARKMRYSVCIFCFFSQPTMDNESRPQGQCNDSVQPLRGLLCRRWGPAALHFLWEQTRGTGFKPWHKMCQSDIRKNCLSQFEAWNWWPGTATKLLSLGTFYEGKTGRWMGPPAKVGVTQKLPLRSPSRSTCACPENHCLISLSTRWVCTLSALLDSSSL